MQKFDIAYGAAAFAASAGAALIGARKANKRITPTGLVAWVRGYFNGSTKGRNKMSLLDHLSNLKKFAEEMKQVADMLEAATGKVAKAVEFMAPIAAKVAPLTGSAAPEVTAAAKLAETAAVVVDQAIQAHQSAAPQ